MGYHLCAEFKTKNWNLLVKIANPGDHICLPVCSTVCQLNWKKTFLRGSKWSFSPPGTRSSACVWGGKKYSFSTRLLCVKWSKVFCPFGHKNSLFHNVHTLMKGFHEVMKGSGSFSILQMFFCLFKKPIPKFKYKTKLICLCSHSVTLLLYQREFWKCLKRLPA